MPLKQSPATARQRIEETSRPLLTRLHRLPRLLVPLLTVLLVAVGALAPLPVAITAFGVLFVFIGWIAYLSWPVVPLSGRLMRIGMLALVVVFAVVRLQP